MEEKTSPGRTPRWIHRLGLSSLCLGVLATLLNSWAAYWFGPAEKRHRQPEAEVHAHLELSSTRPAPHDFETISAPQTIEDLLRSSPVSLMEWQTRVEMTEGDRIDRERRFRNELGKKVIWEGYFDQFHVVEHPAAPDQALTLVMHESRAALTEKRSLLGPPFIRCWWPRDAQSQLSQLHRGQWIVIRGRISNPALAGSLLCTDLTECELITAADVRAVETVLSPPEKLVR